MEFIRYSMIWVALLGAAVAFGSNEHVYISFFQNKFPKNIWFWISIIAKIFLVFFLGIMIIGGTKLSINNLNQISLGLQIPMFYSYIAIPIGGLVMLPYILLNMINSILSQHS
jgi:TRAP-type C4-dicarboxylate transport system permease small subunit